MLWMGSNGLVVRSRLQGQKVPGSKPNSIKALPIMGPVAHQIKHSGQTPFWLVWCRSLERGVTSQVLFLPSNHSLELGVHPKIALVLLQKQDVNITKLN
ncbi:hypothetical protein AVEN_164850-1 [Araneus ventricosus]|uniref:Uncharacterized protein n=1 Tax=Araneus ventricosus TaxID=182803 RepID=A0A4Y2IR79_ARAVE|nr:hypothetical protein AVEN_164850-1 [Araneus ventricosus]